ncbi:MAG: sigma-70 family RNA polymerase sigma factor [Planctomycetes bacterium]|nr:sigma-70 family RNA polymerase sigma factor [Planctomycetota bacterium]
MELPLDSSAGPSDDQLLLRARAADRDALEQLLLRHGPHIRERLEINPKWQSVLEPSDIMQVTYFEAFLQISNFKGDGRSFPGWLRRIAENNLRDAIQSLERDKRPQPSNRISAPENENDFAWLYDLITGGMATPSWHAMDKELRQLLEAEIDALPRDWGNVVRWVFFDGLGVVEVAAKLGKTPGAVHLMRIRAVGRLRQQLGSDSKFLNYH